MITRLRHIPMAFFATLILCAFTSCAPALALDDDWDEFLPHSGQSILDMLNRQEVVEITLEADFRSLAENRNSDNYLAADFTYKDEAGVKHGYQVKVKPRGKFRRRVCDFPPLKLKFSKEELEASGLNEMNELKLVTHCLDDKLQGNEQVVREYLLYKMYNELTPMSLRVQLAKITYIDRGDKDKKTTRWAFLIEDEEELEQRHEAEVCECMGQQKENIQETHEKILSVFQYMIGNTDWNLEMVRNVKLLRTGVEKLIPVPYDFDFSAMVSAPYARPNVDFNQRSINDRIFMGYSSSTDELYSTFSYFKSKKEDLYEIIWNCRQLDNTSKDAMSAYLDSFYMLIDDLPAFQKMVFSKFNAGETEITR